MPVLALNAYAHNAAVALYDGRTAVAAEQERFDGVKKSGAFPREAIQNVILPEVNPADLACIAYPWKPSRFATTYLKVFCNDLPRSLELIDPRCSPRLNIFSGMNVLFRLRSQLREVLRSRLPRIHFVEHHLAHAANAFYSSPFDRALVLVADAFGDICSLSTFIGEGQHIRKMYENAFLDSLGMLYACVTIHLGYRPLLDEGKVMALAGLGNDSLVPAFEQIARFAPDGKYAFDFSYLNFNHSGERRPFTEKFEQAFGPPRRSGDSLLPAHYNLARALQRTTEDTMLHVLRAARARYGIDRLCIAGGVALNCLANGRIAREADFRSVFVPPAPDDSGAVLGAAHAVAHMTLGIPRNGALEHADLGPEYTDARMRAALNGTPYCVSEPGDVAESAAELIDSGQIVGWFQGRMEFGPRALGYRSILADPRRADFHAKLNALKHRESFRPFAPAVLAERCDELFDGACASPFMNIAARARVGARERIPAALHVDGTARIQTLDAHRGGPLRAVVEAFYRRTGVPCVINTSLNCAAPIAATPEDALACFERAHLDALFLGPYLVTRRSA